MNIDWTKAPEGYDYYIVDKEGSIKADFHKKSETCFEKPSYEDPEGFHWDQDSGRIEVYERPTHEQKPKFRFYFRFKRTSGTPTWYDEDVKTAQIISTNVEEAEDSLLGVLPVAETPFWWAIDLIMIQQVDTH